MRKGGMLRLGFCLGVLSLCLYSYQHKQNQLTQLRIKLPQMEKEVKGIREENRRLRYEIDRIESPSRLIELAHHPEFSHLKHPLVKEIMTVPEGIALQPETGRFDELW